MELYLVAVIGNPTKKQSHDEGTSPVVVVQPVAVMAKDENQAAMKAYRLVPEEWSGKEDRLDVRVLPFRSVTR